eukprot:TRINITY_DN210_c0_g1_i1.p1 TRINITY_DN210_c0_g1~~TRINITY_DN210_c0_g1_i1.p1  ORF type:complete len:1016 (+),score=278.41 TRINITY_DN210_c0_g1_i1:186-3050(+)
MAARLREQSPPDAAAAAAAAPTGAPSTRLQLRFCTSARTHFGQSVVLRVQSQRAELFELSFEPEGARWALQRAFHLTSPSAALRYKYGVRDAQQHQVRWERGDWRQLHVAACAPSRVLLRDEWREQSHSERSVFATSAFCDVVFRRASTSHKLLRNALRDAREAARGVARDAFVLLLELFVARVRERDELCVMGEHESMTRDVANAPRMLYVGDGVWRAYVPLRVHDARVKFWFAIRRDGVMVVRDAQPRELVMSEQDVRFVRERGEAEAVAVVRAACDAPFAFERRWKGAGVALPVFSIRSKRSFGVGEFTDLPLMVRLCEAAGFQLLQLLPLNDTRAHNNYMDCYPYSAVSSFALHPQYLNVEALGDMPPQLRREYESKRQQLNALAKIDYMKMMSAKDYFIKSMYKLQRDRFLQSQPFLHWFEQHQRWLVPYALFRFFMEINGSCNYDEWGARAHISVQQMNELASPDSFHFEYLALTYYIQFHLHKQLKAAADFAAEHHVIFKGDLPIGVNRYCADTWTNPHLFRLHMQVGAPPDYFSVHGQNWAFPTYHWDVMKKDNYAWWRCRLQHMSNYFHAYRIDHILGFFRIWEIPQSCRTGMAGRFYPAHGITREELESLGLWDMERYTKPYVRDGLLQHMFQHDWLKMKEKFFEAYYDRLQFKEAYNTEKKMEHALALPEDAPLKERKYSEMVLKNMYVLFNNVCLLQDVEHVNVFHPRFMLHQTSSFMELPSEHWKQSLHRLHDEYMHERQDELWRRNGLERLPMMKSASRMLVCGEDLGMIPKCVPSVMAETGILSLAVQRMPAGDVEFGLPAEYKYECVATTSSHDTSTFRGWWEQMGAEQRLRYWTQVMKRDARKAPPASCAPDICEWAVRDHLKSAAMWAIFPLQDLLAMEGSVRRKVASEEQINEPSSAEHNWCFRLHLNVEDILSNTSFVQRLAALNAEAGRGVAY